MPCSQEVDGEGIEIAGAVLFACCHPRGFMGVSVRLCLLCVLINFEKFVLNTSSFPPSSLASSAAAHSLLSLSSHPDSPLSRQFFAPLLREVESLPSFRVCRTRIGFSLACSAPFSLCKAVAPSFKMTLLFCRLAQSVASFLRRSEVRAVLLSARSPPRLCSPIYRCFCPMLWPSFRR